MNRAEMLAWKDKLEKEIEASVRKFQINTGLTVTYIELMRVKVSTVGKPGDGMRLDTVKTTVKLTDGES